MKTKPAEFFSLNRFYISFIAEHEARVTTGQPCFQYQQHPNNLTFSYGQIFIDDTHGIQLFKWLAKSIIAC